MASTGVIVSNACRHSCPASAGKVRVALLRNGGERFRLLVEENGVGIDNGVPKGTSVGTKLIRTMARSLEAAVAYAAVARDTRAALR